MMPMISPMNESTPLVPPQRTTGPNASVIDSRNQSNYISKKSSASEKANVVDGHKETNKHIRSILFHPISFILTSLLNEGKNAVGAMLGDGWYAGTLGWVSQWGIYGKRKGLL